MAKRTDRAVLSYSEVSRLLSYDPETGDIRWRVRPHRSRVKPGNLAGCIHPEGYRLLSVCSVQMAAHVLAWFLLNHEWPDVCHVVLHRNGDRLDNRAANLSRGERAPSGEFSDLVSYDPESGQFAWKYAATAKGDLLKGEPGWTNADGYVVIGSGRRFVMAHRLAYEIMTGRPFPAGRDIDHINGLRSDNRWANLRIASRSQNNMNAKVREDNSSGHKGVSFDRARKQWAAEIRAFGERHHLGRFDRIEDAIAARQRAENKMFGEFSLSARKEVS